MDENAQALQFQIASNFQLASFQGSLLSYKHHMSSTTAIRGGASLHLQLGDRNLAPEDQKSPTQGRYRLGLQGQYLTYLGSESKIEPYYGVGPRLSYFRDSREEPSGSSQTQTEFRMGITGVAGVEWFVWSNVSFLAEYTTTFEYVTQGQTRVPAAGAEINESRTYWYLRGGGVRFGISAYF